MNQQELIEGARAVLERRLKVSAAQITFDTRVQDLGADSLDLLLIVGEFEDLFSVDISTREIGEIGTFGDIVRRLSTKLGAAA